MEVFLPLGPESKVNVADFNTVINCSILSPLSCGLEPSYVEDVSGCFFGGSSIFALPTYGLSYMN